MVAVGLVNAVAVCLIGSVTGHQTITMAAPIERSNLLFAYQTSPTGYIRTGLSALNEWMSHLARTLRRNGDAFGALVEAGEAISRGRDLADFVAAIRRTVPPACAILSDIADNAAADAKLYDPDADAEGDRLWLRYLAGVQATAADCLALARAETEPEILEALETLTPRPR